MGPAAQRRWLRILALLMPEHIVGLASRFENISGLEVEMLSSKNVEAKGVVLYLHGGAFCLGGSPMYRGLCSHLAIESGMPVWIPNYRLAPEHP